MLAALALLGALGEASTVRAELLSTDARLDRSLDVKVLHGYPTSPNGYYGPVTFGLELRNRGPERTVHVTITWPVLLERSIRVPAGERVRSFFYLPQRSDGRSVAFDLVDSVSGGRRALVAEARSAGDTAIARLGPISSALNVDKPWVLIGAIDGRIPDDWRGLAGVRAIVVEHDYAATQPLAWRVLIDWVSMGGVLLVATSRERAAAPPPWPAELPFASPPLETEGGIVQQVGYGAVARVWPETLSDVSGPFLQNLGVCEACLWSVSGQRFSGDSPFEIARLRLRSMIAAPGWGLFSLLLLFALAVGPIGWVMLVRQRGRPLLYITCAVAAAFVSSSSVLAYDMLQNGFGPKVAPRSLLLLDQQRGVEIGFEDAAFYAPTTFGTQLRLAPGVDLLFPMPTRGYGEAAPAITRAGDRTLVDGALPVRERRLLAARWLARSRARLEVEDGPEGLWLENQTGKRLESLVLWHGTAAYTFGAVDPGKRMRGQASDPAHLTVPQPSDGPVLGAAAPLVRAIANGDLGSDRFVAKVAWTQAASALLGEQADARAGYEHLLVGVY